MHAFTHDFVFKINACVLYKTPEIHGAIIIMMSHLILKNCVIIFVCVAITTYMALV